MQDIGKQIRRIIIEQSKRAHVGHIGSALSIADLIGALYDRDDGILRLPAPDHPDRDRFVLSKGHAALALYAAFYLRGWIDAAQLNTYHNDHSLLGVHPEHALTGVDFCTGSLGQGLSMGTGAALAAKLQGSKRRVFVLISDAELNEGSTWEALLFAAQHKLANLIALVDLNGQQALGYTRNVIGIQDLAERWRGFGWDAHDVDGHDPAALRGKIAALDTDFATGKPHVLVAKTIFGSGVSYMTSQIRWHYMPMTDDEYRQALAEIEAR